MTWLFAEQRLARSPIPRQPEPNTAPRPVCGVRSAQDWVGFRAETRQIRTIGE
jgi:hypothetical protein